MINLLKKKLHIKEKSSEDYLRKKYKYYIERIRNLRTVEDIDIEIVSINSKIDRLYRHRVKSGMYLGGIVALFGVAAGESISMLIGSIVAHVCKENKKTQLKDALVDDPAFNEIMTKFQADSPGSLHHYIDLLKGGLDYSQSALSTEEVLQLITKYDDIMASIESQASDYAMSIWGTSMVIGTLITAGVVAFPFVRDKYLEHCEKKHDLKIDCYYALKKLLLEKKMSIISGGEQNKDAQASQNTSKDNNSDKKVQDEIESYDFSL